jgi:hypothetical protein
MKNFKIALWIFCNAIRYSSYVAIFIAIVYLAWPTVLIFSGVALVLYVLDTIWKYANKKIGDL